MKIDKRRPLHWLFLGLFFAQALIGAILRAASSRSGKLTVVLYGHKLNGNLLALYSHLKRSPDLGMEPVFLTMDRAYHSHLEKSGINSCWACAPACSTMLSQAAALVSDHGLHSLHLLIPLYRRMGMRFFDVWHGIPFKGFDADDFRLQQRYYDETWVASDENRKLYVEKFGFRPDQVIVTGYARTDKLVCQTEQNAEYRQRFGLPPQGKLILFAPTWAQDTQGRSIYPFGHSEAEFLGALSNLGQRHKVTFIIRTHLNSKATPAVDYPGLVRLPSSEHPDTEGILLAADMMICDWSSIAFDYLLLDRPTFFLDVPPPFRKGFSLGPEYRFGEKVKDLDALLKGIETCLLQPESYWRTYGELHQQVKTQVYGGIADGKAADRYVTRLNHHFVSGESSR